MNDIIKLETGQQDIASDAINHLYTQATEHRAVYARNVIKQCYEGDSWDTIKNRMNTEGSCWYVWYMDGVNRYIQLYQKSL